MVASWVAVCPEHKFREAFDGVGVEFVAFLA
jgi:hypothetical protein